MRELLSLRRNEEPIIGEVYKYGPYYVKCVAAGDAGKNCENCVFNKKYCPFPCNWSSNTKKKFIWILEREIDVAADVKFRHIEETKDERPKKGEIFIASVGLVTLIDIADTRFKDCALCDLTMSECDSCDCLPNHCYKKISR